MNRIKIPVSYKIMMPLGFIISILLFHFLSDLIYDNQNFLISVIISFLCLYYFFFFTLMIILLGVLPFSKYSLSTEENLEKHQRALNTQNRKEAHAIKIGQILSSLPAIIISELLWYGYGDFSLGMFFLSIVIIVGLGIILYIFEIPVNMPNKIRKT